MEYRTAGGARVTDSAVAAERNTRSSQGTLLSAPCLAMAGAFAQPKAARRYAKLVNRRRRLLGRLGSQLLLLGQFA